MTHPFVPLIVLVLLPLLYAGSTLDLQRHAAFRWVVVVVALAIVGAGCWAGGVDFSYLNRMKLFVAAAVALVALGRKGKNRADGTNGTGRADQTLWSYSLVLLLAVPVYLNFLGYHGTGSTRVYVHLHDVAHYYLGSKYFAELGYGDLYTAMLRAEAETYDNHFRAVEARDLRSNAMVHIRGLLQQSEPVKARFAPERWTDFRSDVAWFRETLGPQYGEILKDHGFNPTPVWALLGGAVANLVPAGSSGGVLILTLLDLLVLGAMFAAVAMTFGYRALLLGAIYFCLPYGASFGWTGGGFLRFVWLASVVGAVCAVERRRHGVAGALIALATMLRVFPAAFALALGLGAAARLWRERTIDPAHIRFGVAFAVVATLLFGGTLLRSNGFEHWQEFRANMQNHLQSNAYNTIGLNEVVSYTGPVKPDTAEAFAEETARRSFLYSIQLATAFLLAIGVVFAMSRKTSEAHTIAMASLLLFTGITLASYYWIFLLLFAVLRHDDQRSIAVLFGAEAMIYSLTLFEEREVVLYFYKNVLVGLTLVALYVGSWRSEAASGHSAAESA